jgi:hypothetical protein
MLIRLNQTYVATAALAALAVLFHLLHRWDNLKPHIVETIVACLAAGVLYLVALFALERTHDRRAAFWLILAGALLFRLQLFPLTPVLSDDVHRYRWEGRLQQAGWNPYTVKPEDPGVAALRDAQWATLPGRSIATIYPPLAELIFAATYCMTAGLAAPAGIILFKLPFLAADLLVVALLAGGLRATGGRNFQLAIYAWNPLAVVEFAASGHFDALATSALLAACLLMRQADNGGEAGREKSYPLRESVSTLLLAVGALVKIFPALLFPLWLRRVGWPRKARGWGHALGALAVAAACAWPFRSGWTYVVDSLLFFQERWDNNASLAALLTWLSGSSEVAAGAGVGVVAGLAVWVAVRRVDVLRAAYLLIGATLMLAPNTFSWYFTWILPLVALQPAVRSANAWLLLSVLQFLSYHALLDYFANGVWRFQPLFLWLTYGPFYALLLWQAFSRATATAQAA